jgi:hypothetical protein
MVLSELMTKKRPDTASPQPVYERVPAKTLKSSRKGKHYLVVEGILKNMETLPTGSALKIPVAPLSGVTVVELRSAVMRAVKKRKISVETSSDDENFYVWKT